MKKLFKSSKPKTSELNPTPLALPPETPIHAKHVIPQSAQTPQQVSSRKSTDMVAGAGDRSTWVVVDSSVDDRLPTRPRVDSKPSSIASLPQGASSPHLILAGTTSPLPPSTPAPTTTTTTSAAVVQSAQVLPPSPGTPRSQPLRSPSVKGHSQTVKEPTRRRSGQIFPWPDSRLTDHSRSTTTDDRPANSPRPPSMYSIDTRETHNTKDKDAQLPKPSTGVRIADFFFKETPKQTRNPKEPQYDIEEVISACIFRTFTVFFVLFRD